TLLMIGLEHVIGARSSWRPLLLFFPLAGWAAGRIVPGSGVAQFSGGLLYAMNPIVFERIWAGQVGFLLGYALLPLLAKSLIEATRRPWPAQLWPAVWIALMTAFSVHFLWISAVLVLALIVVDRARMSALILGGITAIATLLLNAYL